MRLSRYFGMSEGFFLGLQTDYELMARRRQIGDQLKAIRPRAASTPERPARPKPRGTNMCWAMCRHQTCG